MLRRTGALPLDYSLCDMTVTVYHREGLTRHVMSGVYYAPNLTRTVREGRETAGCEFLLVIPGEADIAPGDKVVLGAGPQVTDWAALNPADVPGLGVIEKVTPRYFGGKLVHTEARG